MEIFKTVEFRGRTFTVGNYGTLLTEKGLPRKLHLNSSGYMCLTKDKLYFLHRIVATAFCENDDPINKNCVNHIDGNRMNNRADNLEWVTKSQNMLHSVRVLKNKVNVEGLKKNWENPIQSKPVKVVNEETGQEIVFNSCKKAGEYLGISSSVVYNLLKGKSKPRKKYKIYYIEKTDGASNIQQESNSI